MKNRLIMLMRYIHHFGFIKGLGLSMCLRNLKTGYVTLKKYGKIYLRKNSSDIGIFNQIFIDKEYDIKLSFEPRCIVDCGANIGLTSLFFAVKYPLATIFSFEPEAENFKILKTNTQLFPKIIPVNKAIWSKDGVISLVKSNSFDSHSVIEPVRNSDTVDSITVKSILDEYSLPGIDVLKMDIEGGEKEIFEAETQSWLPKIKVLIIELHDRMKPGCSMSLFNTLRGYNYSMSIKGELLIFEFK